MTKGGDTPINKLVTKDKVVAVKEEVGKDVMLEMVVVGMKGFDLNMWMASVE